MAPGGDRQSLIEPSYLTQKGVPGGEGHWLEAPSEVLPIDSRSGTYHQLMFLLSLSPHLLPWPTFSSHSSAGIQ